MELSKNSTTMEKYQTKLEKFNLTQELQIKPIGIPGGDD